MATVKFPTPFFSTASQQFLQLRQSELRQSTIKTFYNPSFKNFLSVVGDKPLNTYTSLDIAIFAQEKRKTTQASTTNFQLRALKSLGNWLVSMELLPEKNPFSKIKLLKQEVKPIRFLSLEEFSSVYNAEKNEMLKAVYLMAVNCGFRISQLLNIKFSQINFEQGTILLTSEYSKNNRTTLLPLNGKALSICRNLYSPSKIFLFQKTRACCPTVYSSLYVSHCFRKTATSVGIYNASFHTLRKTFISWLLHSGVSIFHASKLATHSNVATTTRFYAGVSLEDLGEQVNRLPSLQK